MADEQITLGEGTRYPLNGILSLPDHSSGLLPAVVLVQGSGPSNRDEKVGNNTPFKDLAEGLSEKGIAVVRYDKRTYVYGKEMRNDRGISVKEETIEDAIQAADFLRKDPRIDARRVFIIGHSLGGMLAPRIDADGGNFAGIIIMAGSPRKLEEIMIEQSQELVNSLNAFLKIIAKKQIKKLNSKFNNIYNLSDAEAQSTKVIGKYVSAYYFKEMGTYPSIAFLKELDKPVFILQGDQDFHVSTEKDFEGYRKLLGEKPNITYKLYPNLNHLFMPVVYGKILKMKKEYKVPQHVDHEVIKDLADWILSF